MAIELVKEGNFNPDEQFHVTCDRCGSIFNFLRKDAMYGDHVIIECPKCQQTIHMDDWQKGKAPTE